MVRAERAWPPLLPPESLIAGFSHQVLAKELFAVSVHREQPVGFHVCNVDQPLQGIDIGKQLFYVQGDRFPFSYPLSFLFLADGILPKG